MKKYSWVAIGCMCLILLGYSVIAYANEPSSSSSKEITGSFIAIVKGTKEIQLNTSAGAEVYPLAKSVWVYRNNSKAGLQDLKPGDKLEIILNTSKQAAYVKAFSTEGETKQAAPSPSPTAAASASPSPTAAPSPAIPSSGLSLQERSSASEDGWDKLKVKVEGKGVNLELEQEFSGNSHKSKANIHTKQQGTIKLEGDSAALFIQNIIKNVDLHSASADAQLLAEISKQLGIAESGLRLDLDLKLQDKDEDDNEGEDDKEEEHQKDKHAKSEKKEKYEKQDKHDKNKHDD